MNNTEPPDNTENIESTETSTEETLIKETSSILLTRFHPSDSIETVCETIKKLTADYCLPLYASVPLSYLNQLKTSHPDIVLGVETLLDVNPEAFTSSVALPLLTKHDVKFVLIGTADERKKNVNLQQKLESILGSTLLPIICIGESWQEFCDEQSEEILQKQLSELIADIPEEQRNGLHVLYDAFWISDTPWENDNKDLLKAYEQFRHVVEEIIPNPKLIYSIPYGEKREALSIKEESIYAATLNLYISTHYRGERVER